MHQLLFKNRFHALVFVAIILFSVRILVGTDNEHGALEEATEQFGTSQQAEAAPARARPAPQAVATEFTPDEDLIDDTTGLDPSGWSSEPAAEREPGLETAEVQPDETEG